MTAPYRNAAVPLNQRVEDLLARMTMQEKLGQLNQQLFQSHETAEQWIDGVRAGTAGSFYTQHSGPTLHNQLQKVAIEASRLGIPLSFGTDIIHECRVIFSVSLGLSCAWEPGLLERSQAVAAREARRCGIDWIFAPMCDLARDAR